MAEVRLRFLGSGDAFGSGGRLQACMQLEGGEEIAWIALSHLHGDHFAGLPFLFLDGQFAGRTRPLVIAGPAGTQERVGQTLEALFPGAGRAKRSFEIQFVELQERHPCELGPATITPFQVRHPSGAPAYALRIEYGDKVIAYSGDTAWTDNLLQAAQGADLFVCEAYFFEKKVPYHLDYRTLAEKREALDCTRVVVTHMSADMLARVPKLDIESAADGAVIAV